MTLRENFDKISCKDCDMPWCDVGCTILSDSELDRLEKIADNYAIGFAEWLSEKERTKLQCKSYCKKHTMWFTDKKGIGATTKELLEIYKKEKGL
jgi:hypothetical protein